MKKHLERERAAGKCKFLVTWFYLSVCNKMKTIFDQSNGKIKTEKNEFANVKELMITVRFCFER